MALTPAQIAWLNQQVANPCRRTRRIVKHLRAAHAGQQITAAFHGLLLAMEECCRETHRQLEASRPPPANPSKPSRYTIGRCEADLEARQSRARHELGLEPARVEMSLEDLVEGG